MSESSAFANYSNTTQMLQSGVNQLAATNEQTTDDKANFEQQFLIGAALTAKTKAGEKFVGLIKKSKGLKAIKEKATKAAEDLAKNARQKANDLADQLKSKIPKLDGSPSTEPPAPPAAPEPPAPPAAPEPPAPPSDELKAAQDAKDLADKESDATNTLKSAADDEVENSTADLAAARVSEQTASDVAEQAAAKASADISGRIGTDVINARRAFTGAKATRVVQEARNAKALEEQTRLEQLAEQKAGTAQRAGTDLNNAQDAEKATQDAKDAQAAQQAAQDAKDAQAAQQAAQDAKDAQAAASQSEEAASAAGNAGADAEKLAEVAKAAKEAEDLEKAAKAAKDVEEATAATDEADPVGFLVTAAAAAATQLIGRKIRAHVLETSNIQPSRVTYSSTLGA